MGTAIAPMTGRRHVLGGMAALTLAGFRPAYAGGATVAKRDTSPAGMLAACQMLGQALTSASQPEAGLRALDQALAQTVGHKLFTVLVLNWEKKENQRYYSNQPGAYPTGGSKPIVEKGWFYENVIMAGRPQIQHGADDIVRAFPDHALIRSLGCESAINYPLRFAGRTIGSLNLLHEAGWYTEADEPTLQLLAAFALPLVMEIVRQQAR
jgi:hypothetical protein